MSLSSLPFELRRTVWNLAIEEPRVFELYLVDPPLEPDRIGFKASRAVLNSDRCTHSVGVRRTVLPLLLQICRESRLVGLGIYQKLWARSYINFAVDRVLIAPDLFGAIWWCIDSCVGDGLLGLSKVEHIVLFFPYRFPDDQILRLRLEKMSHFLARSSPKLRKITFAFDDRRFLQDAEYLFKAFPSTVPLLQPSPELLKEVIPLDYRRDLRCNQNIYLCSMRCFPASHFFSAGRLKRSRQPDGSK